MVAVGADPDVLDRVAVSLSGLAESLRSLLAERTPSLVGAGRFTGVDLATPLGSASRVVVELRRLAGRTQGVATAFREVGAGVGAPPPIEMPRWVTALIPGRGPMGVQPPPEARYAANRAAVSALLDSGLVEDAGLRKWLQSLLEPGPDGTPRQIWSFSLPEDGDEGRVIEVWGDLAGAEHVAILVPGMGSTAENFDDRVGTRARNLLRAATSLGSGPVAVVGWFDYDAPDDLPSLEVVHDSRARVGALDLNRFLGLLPPRPGRHLTLIGHSFGSVLVGAAMSGTLAPLVDDVLVMGSPGTGVDSVKDFSAPGTEFYTMEAPLDPIPDLDWFGTNPNELESGFRRVETGPARGHSSYLSEGSEGLDNAALIVTGRGDEASVRGRSAADWLEEGSLQLDHLRDRMREAVPDSVIPGGVDDEVLDRITQVLAAGDSISDFISETVTDAVRAAGDLARLGQLVADSFVGTVIPDPLSVPDWSVFRLPIPVVVGVPVGLPPPPWDWHLPRVVELVLGD